jgi:large subunit ribosomal protein L30
MAEAKKAKSEAGAAPKAAPKAKKPEAASPQAAAPKAVAPKAPKAAKGLSAGPKVKVRLVRSGIGTPKDQRATLKGLGLSHLNQERELLDSAPLRGMLRKVRHLVSVDGQPAA